MRIAFTLHAEVEETSLAAFRDRYPGARIEAIDDHTVVGTCEACSEPVFERGPLEIQNYFIDSEDSCLFHIGCWDPGEDDQVDDARNVLTAGVDIQAEGAEVTAWDKDRPGESTDGSGS